MKEREDDYYRVPHIRQEYTWDCGIACVKMVLSSLSLLQTSSIFLRNLIPSTNPWTMDLVEILYRYGVKDFTYFTSYIGVNWHHLGSSFYRDSIKEDQTRIFSLFSTAKEKGIRVISTILPMDDIRRFLISGDFAIIILVDLNRLRCLRCDKRRRSGVLALSCFFPWVSSCFKSDEEDISNSDKSNNHPSSHHQHLSDSSTSLSSPHPYNNKQLFMTDVSSTIHNNNLSMKRTLTSNNKTTAINNTSTNSMTATTAYSHQQNSLLSESNSTTTSFHDDYSEGELYHHQKYYNNNNNSKQTSYIPLSNSSTEKLLTHESTATNTVSNNTIITNSGQRKLSKTSTTRRYSSYETNTEYQGHYIVLIRYDKETDTFVYRDPGCDDQLCQIESDVLEAARNSPGADHDTIVININPNYLN